MVSGSKSKGLTSKGTNLCDSLPQSFRAGDLGVTRSGVGKDLFLEPGRFSLVVTDVQERLQEQFYAPTRLVPGCYLLLVYLFFLQAFYTNHVLLIVSKHRSNGYFIR
jgi:hypothetical protein